MDDKKQDSEEKEDQKDKLEGLELNINELGEITSTLDMDKINKFLDENVVDKKFKDEEE